MPEDQGNGRYERSLMMGKRGHPEETQGLLLGLLAASRSIGADKATLAKMGLPGSGSGRKRGY